MSRIFDTDEGADEAYIDLARGTDSRSREVREILERLGEAAAPYLDRDFRTRIRLSFQQGFWEAYSCATLRQAGLPVVPRVDRRKQNAGPDIQVGDVEAWFEAIAVTSGTGRDAVPARDVHGVVEIPDSKL